MTLEEYKSQLKELKNETNSFSGSPEEAVKISEDLSEKYAEVKEFNSQAAICKNLEEFKKVADSFGMKFSSDESAEKLYSVLKEKDSSGDGMELSDDDLDSVTGGNAFWIICNIIGLGGPAIAKEIIEEIVD